jgi:hypothetical protein
MEFLPEVLQGADPRQKAESLAAESLAFELSSESPSNVNWPRWTPKSRGKKER